MQDQIAVILTLTDNNIEEGNGPRAKQKGRREKLEQEMATEAVNYVRNASVQNYDARWEG